MSRRNHRKRWIWIAIGAVIAGGCSVAAARFTHPQIKIPTALVKRGVLTGYLTLRGQLVARRSVTLRAPMQAGDQIRILKLVSNGARVTPGEVVIQFDASKMQQSLQEKKSALRQAEAEIKQSRAKATMTQQQDRTDVMKARYTLESAKLDAGEQAILSKIDGEEKQLAVADAAQALRQAEQKLKADKASGAAELKDKEQARDKNLFDVERTEREIASMTVRAPMGGLVTILPNLRAGGFFENGPPFKPGDQAWAGARIIELPDLSTIRADARVGEVDRGKMRLGLPVMVRVEAVPGNAFAGRITQISALAKVDFSAGWPPARNFDFEVQLQKTDPRMRPGMTASLRITVDRIPNSILIPSRAAFQKSGETVAYALKGYKFLPRPIEISGRGGGNLAVASGLVPGDRVALQDPTARR
jgi:HlyD family secretion protein